MKKDFSTFTLEKAMPHLHLTLFGSFGAMLDGEPANGFESNKVRALLAYLAVESAQAHTRAALAGLFWPECPERQARQNLSQAVYNLRHLLGDIQNLTPFLLTTPQTIQFNSNSDYWLDVTAFTHAIQQQDLPATSPNPQSSITNHQSPVSNLPQAAALYTAPFLQEFAIKDGLAFEEWALITRERLHRLALHALQTLAAHHESRGELDEALRHARRAVELDPLWEAAHRQVIHLLAQSGARTQALVQYETLRHTLADALGVEPELETQKLYERLQAAPSPNSAAPRSHHLPAFLTPFIGREQELAEVTAHLCDPDCRLLTVLGPGGSGKTRFVVEAARRVTDAFPDGVRFISLAAVTTPDGIIPAVVRGLELYLQENIPAERQVQDYLREKGLLLLLDNYEHLLPEVAWPVQILREAAGVKLLITSRAPLNVKGEHHYPLSGLAIPRVGDTLSGARFSAVQLFVDAAQHAWPQFHLTGDTLPPIVDICRAVDGLPLGVILAAAWVGSYTPNEILEEMRRDLDFLATTWADVPERQRSLRATFAYSWRLLSDPERAVMRALSVFRGGFTREAAREVGGATARDLLNLANKSLIQATGNGRFYLHELVRQFAREQLDAIPEEAQGTNTRHSAYFLTKLTGWAVGLKGPRQRETLEEMDMEAANIQAAWNWAVETGDWERIGRGLEGLGMYSSRRARVEEAVAQLQKARTVLHSYPEIEGSLSLLTRLWVWEGWFHSAKPQLEPAAQAWKVGDRLLNGLSPNPQTTQTQALRLYFEGETLMFREIRQATVLMEQSTSLFRELKDWYWLGQALSGLIRCGLRSGKLAEAEAYSIDMLTLEKEINNPRGVALALNYQADIFVRMGRVQEAIEVEQEALALFKSLGESHNPGDMGAVLICSGQFQAANTFLQQALERRRGAGEKYGIAFTGAQLGLTHLFLGRYEEARQLICQGLPYMKEHHHHRITAHLLVSLGLLTILERNDEHGYNLCLEGVELLRQTHMLDELDYPLFFLACAARFAGHPQIANETLQEGFLLSQKNRYSPFLGFGLVIAALMALDQRKIPEAVVLYTAALRYPMVANAHFMETVFGKEIREAAHRYLSPETIAEAEARGQVCDPFEVAQELLTNHT